MKALKWMVGRWVDANGGSTVQTDVRCTSQQRVGLGAVRDGLGVKLTRQGQGKWVAAVYVGVSQGHFADATGQVARHDGVERSDGSAN